MHLQIPKKKCKKANLYLVCQIARWEVRYFSVEVESRGFTDQTIRACFKYLKLSDKEIKKAVDEISKTAPKAIFTIWLSRKNRKFKSWKLVQRPEVSTAMQLEREGPGAKGLDPPPPVTSCGSDEGRQNGNGKKNSRSWAWNNIPSSVHIK